MSTASQNNDNQEIDLSEISKKIAAFFEKIILKTVRGFLFIKKNSKIVGLLFLTGIVLGFYLDATSKIYDNEIILVPNFGSTDYLYSKINLINSKIEEQDLLFLKKVVGIKKPSNIKKITVEPINDVYKFIENKAQNFEFIKLLAEDGDIKKIVTDNLTSKNYPFHALTFTTTGLASDSETVKPILNYLNQSDYFSKIQKEYLNNIKLKIIANDLIIAQIDGFLNSFSSKVNGTSKNDKLIYYNENSQLNDVIKTKNELVTEQGVRRIDLINNDQIIKETSRALNLKSVQATNGKLKYILPLLFVFLYLIIIFTNKFYKKQVAKIKV